MHRHLTGPGSGCSGILMRLGRPGTTLLQPLPLGLCQIVRQHLKVLLKRQNAMIMFVDYHGVVRGGEKKVDEDWMCGFVVPKLRCMIMHAHSEYHPYSDCTHKHTMAYWF